MALISRGEAQVEEGFSHRPVLLRETVQHLEARPGGVYVDCTVGEGGHAEAILQAAMPGGHLLGIDLDPNALEGARRRLARFDGAFTLARGSYAGLQELLQELNIPQVDGVLLDLGLSSPQLETSGRGFSFNRDEPLDMRYDPEAALTADGVVNGYPFNDLAGIIFSYGEERRSRAIARAIIEQRPIRTTRELSNLVTKVCGPARGRIHPATRTFQALRIEVNSELENLKAGLNQSIGALKPGGRLVVISYHSLEDRIAKETMVREARGCICPPGPPVCTCGHVPSLRMVFRKVMTPSPDELRENPRSRSARMRVSERL